MAKFRPSSSSFVIAKLVIFLMTVAGLYKIIYCVNACWSGTLVDHVNDRVA